MKVRRSQKLPTRSKSPAIKSPAPITRVWQAISCLLLSLGSPALVQCSNNLTAAPTNRQPPTIPEAAGLTQLAQQLAVSYASKTPGGALPITLTLPQGRQVGETFRAEIGKTLGAPVGYKVGLTNAAVQQRFGVSHPLWGVLFAKMLLESGAVLSPDVGARPITEGDLLVRVAGDEINQARTPQEVLAGLDAVIPFIEIADLFYGEDVAVNAGAIAAINVGARLGIMGEPIPISPTPEWENRLANMRVEILDANGNPLDSGNGTALLGHPLNVVLWLKDTLNAEGKQLKKGDLISLGTITKPMPVQPNTTIRAKYIGLDPNGAGEIFVQFSSRSPL